MITKSKENKKETKVFKDSGLRKDNMSFVEIVSGVPDTKRQAPKIKFDVYYNSPTEDRDWVNDCYIDFLKRKFTWEEHSEELLSECGRS